MSDRSVQAPMPTAHLATFGSVVLIAPTLVLQLLIPLSSSSLFSCESCGPLCHRFCVRRVNSDPPLSQRSLCFVMTSFL